MRKKRTRGNGIDNRLQLVAIFLLVIVAVPALVYGWNFMAHRSGESMGFNVEMLKTTPFNDFFYPGLILFVVIGVLSVAAGVLVFFEAKNYPRVLLMHTIAILAWLTAEVYFGLYEPKLHLPFYGIVLILLIIGVLMKLKKKTTIINDRL